MRARGGVSLCWGAVFGTFDKTYVSHMLSTTSYNQSVSLSTCKFLITEGQEEIDYLGIVLHISIYSIVLNYLPANLSEVYISTKHVFTFILVLSLSVL